MNDESRRGVFSWAPVGAEPRLRATALLTTLALTACGGSPVVDEAIAAAAAPDPAYVQEVNAWHFQRIESLRGEHSWLTLVGLFWLEEGENTFGSAPDNDVVFPDKAPPHCGTLTMANGQVVLTAVPDAGLVHEGEPVTTLTMVSDLDENKTRVHVGSFNFYVIDRGGRLGLRLKDQEAEVYTSFQGIDRFPVDPKLRFEARWDPYDPPKMVQTPNVLGQVSEEESPGAIVFDYQGETLRLEPSDASDGQLFLVFGDASNGEETYGGGRFLFLDPPVNGRVVLDFNKAYNPPCVFSPYATCPLPRQENKLPVAIRAGEKNWGGHHEPA